MKQFLAAILCAVLAIVAGVAFIASRPLDSYSMGMRYAQGKDGVKQDYAEAAKWFRKSAEHGSARAQYDMGILYSQGRGVPQDYKEAAQWYRKAADQGMPQAEYNLGLLYHQGFGVEQDDKEAEKWWQKAAAQGIVFAKQQLDALKQNNAGDAAPAPK
jgi:TPR repeat protein